MANILLMVGDIFINNEIFLVTDFVNFKIKSDQSFRDTHKSSMCVDVFIIIVSADV
jgi:hypothetical protein